MRNADSITNYFKDRINSCEFPLLLGLSGGPDSMALFHLLKTYGAPFEVAHIDHGWREESAAEASYLREVCESAGVPFHLKKLEPFEKEGNLEDRARKARLAFFKALCETRDLKGVALAHHADDQAETVLKRFFEGASLPKLRGLLSKVEIDGITIYRPLLKLKKENILQWLKEREIPYFLDETNRDSRFLRARLRHELIPTLSQQFGKQIGSSLCRLGEAAVELGEFLETLVAPFRNQVELVDEGWLLDLSTNVPQTTFVFKAVLRDFFEKRKISLPQSVLETLIMHIQSSSCHTLIHVGKRRVKIHRKRVTILFRQDTVQEG